MTLPTELHNSIVRFLASLPGIEDETSRRALLNAAGLDHRLHSRLSVTAPPEPCFQELVPALMRYGRLKDGRHALEAVLEAAKSFVGPERQKYCDSLLDQARPFFQASETDGASWSGRKKHFPLPAILLIVVLLLGAGVFSWRYFWKPAPDDPLQPPLLTIEHPYVRPDAAIVILAENAAARRKAPLNVRWDDLPFAQAAAPDPGPNTYRWTFALPAFVQAPNLEPGRHTLEVGFVGEAYNAPITVSISTEQPIVGLDFDSDQANPDSITLEGFTASKQQFPEEVLKVEVFFDYDEYPVHLTLPVDRKVDDEGRIYFEFETALENLPKISDDDPRYAEPFFAFQVTDLAGNTFQDAMSYAQFMAPGARRIRANDLADIQVQKYADSGNTRDMITFAVVPKSALAEYRGKPALVLTAEMHGADVATLSWVSELNFAAKRPIPTLIYRDGQSIATVFDGEQYVDRQAAPDAVYQAEQTDKDGQTYVSNEVTPLPEPTPTATATLTPNERNTPTPEPTIIPTRAPTTPPTMTPTLTPTVEPTAIPTVMPTPTSKPTVTPTPTPTATLEPEPTATPAVKPTATPTFMPTMTPTPTTTPAPAPTATSTATPTATSTAQPTVIPTAEPTASPTTSPAAELLQRAEEYLRRERFTTPAGENAFETYQAVLAIEPLNERAKDGLQRILRTYQELGRADCAKATAYYPRYLSVARYVIEVFHDDALQQQATEIERQLGACLATPTPSPTMTPTAEPTTIPTPVFEPIPTATPASELTPTPTATPPTASITLRSEPRTVSENEMEQVFKVKADTTTYNFTVWRPIEYIDNDFVVQGEVVFDRATGLLWQQSGSDKWVPYAQAETYCVDLVLAGKNEWRLPTMAELLSLLEPEKQSNGLYINPVFNKSQSWIWSSDKRSSESAWYVDFYSGYVNWGTYGNYVRCVRSGQ